MKQCIKSTHDRSHKLAITNTNETSRAANYERVENYEAGFACCCWTRLHKFRKLTMPDSRPQKLTNRRSIDSVRASVPEQTRSHKRVKRVVCSVIVFSVNSPIFLSSSS